MGKVNRSTSMVLSHVSLFASGLLAVLVRGLSARRRLVPDDSHESQQSSKRRGRFRLGFPVDPWIG